MAIDDYTQRSKSLSVEPWGCPRVDISMAELRTQDNGQLSNRLRRDPFRYLRALEDACHEIAKDERPGYDKNGTILHSFGANTKQRAPSNVFRLVSML